ncbi:hypothetical protein JK621_06890 [Serratia plymuthica]|uniref:hypothetical protein n=1 Tax=Serratia plymuthica TaxID=82996 RepID=UPI001BB049E4|nr:hypothetical protein [Serratia plymuthica]QUY49882.1 hypothetical protein JK621_06890 [Serratia plymuthica]
MSCIATVINAVSYLVGACGAIIAWWPGRTEGGGLPFYANIPLIKKVEEDAVKSRKVKDIAMLLVGISFVLQFIALFF